MNNEKENATTGSNPKTVKGIRIQTMNCVMIAAACLLYGLILYDTIQVSSRYQLLVKNTETYITCSQNTFLLKERSDTLTEQIRLYVMTSDISYQDAYLEEFRSDMHLERALEDLKTYNVNQDSLQFLQEALTQSDKLTTKEFYAMRLTGEALGFAPEEFPEEIRTVSLSEEDRALRSEEKISKAQDLVFNSDYQFSKDMIKFGINSCLDSIVSETLEKQELSAATMQQTLILHRIHISLLFILNIITFIIIFTLIIRPLKSYINCIKEEKKLAVTGAYEFRYLASTYNDIYNINMANEAMLRHKAEHDPLTGAINRGAFERVKHALSADPSPLALLLIDVDQFKNINDTYGHEIGDSVLKKVTRLLQENFRIDDLVARIGGDEFAVIATKVTDSQRTILEQKVALVNHALSNPDDGLPKVSLSIGVAFSLNGFQEDLYRKSDKALYHVKKHGRCGCAFFEDLAEGLS
ncbi:MAG: GGDEF domain-containing protein [Lachnospiraceae bacterium]|nr:GGDEF domain-containing protein [Lachnospiraceae bacterium]